MCGAWGAVHASACLADLPPLQVSSTLDAGQTVVSRCGDGVIGVQSNGGYEACDPSDGGVLGCSSNCTLACEGDVDPVTNHCYFSPSEDDERSAEHACIDRGAHLVTFGDAQELAFVRRASFVTGSTTFWVGLTYQGGQRGALRSAANDEPGFPAPPTTTQCSGCFAAGAGAKTDAGYTLPFESDAGTGSAFCVFTSATGTFTRGDCMVHRKTVCEREPPGSRAHVCNGGVCVDLLPTSGGAAKHYLFVPGETTATTARATCETYGARLAVFATAADREAVVRELSRASLTAVTRELTFWVGLVRASDAGWSWVDNASTLEPWGDNAPEEASAGASTQGAGYARTSLDPDDYDQQLAHADFSQTSRRPFVCELLGE